jgi:hypothetical protein
VAQVPFSLVAVVVELPKLEQELQFRERVLAVMVAMVFLLLLLVQP